MFECEQRVRKQILQEEYHLLAKLPDFYRVSLPYQYCLVTKQEKDLKQNIVYIQLHNIKEAYQKHGKFEIAYMDGNFKKK